MTSTRVFLFAVALMLIGSLFFLRELNRKSSVTVQDAERSAGVACAQVSGPFEQQQSGLWVSISGTVSRILPDEFGKFQHQRFVVSCSGRQTVLVVNDTSIGERVPVRVGDSIVVHGQYEWNRQGGLLHFTHRAQGGGQGGWIEFAHKLYSLSPLRLRVAA